MFDLLRFWRDSVVPLFNYASAACGLTRLGRRHRRCPHQCFALLTEFVGSLLVIGIINIIIAIIVNLLHCGRTGKSIQYRLLLTSLPEIKEKLRLFA